MVHCQDRNSRSLGCTVNKNSPCAEGPRQSCTPAFARPHKDRERHHWYAGLEVRGQEACEWERSLRKPASQQKVLPGALTAEENENNRADPGTARFWKTRERCPERYHSKEGPGLGIQAQNKVRLFFLKISETWKSRTLARNQLHSSARVCCSVQGVITLPEDSEDSSFSYPKTGLPVLWPLEHFGNLTKLRNIFTLNMPVSTVHSIQGNVKTQETNLTY